MTEIILYEALNTTGIEVFNGKASDNQQTPFIIYNKTIQTIENHLTGSLSVENSRYQVDIYSSTYSEGKTIETAVRTAIDNITDAKPIIHSIINITEEDLYRIKIDIKLWK